MDTDKQSQDAILPGNVQEARGTSGMSSQTEIDQAVSSKKSKKRIFILLALLGLLVGVSVGAYVVLKKPSSEESTDQPTASEPQTSQTTVQNELKKVIYAYKEGTTTLVKEFALADSKKTDLFSYDEVYAATPLVQGGFVTIDAPEIALDDAGEQYVYVAADGIYVGTTSDRKKIVTRTPTSSAEPIASWTPAIEPSDAQGPPSAYVVSPQWTAVKDHFAYSIARYEGSSVGVMNAKTAEYVDIGETFLYVLEPLPLVDNNMYIRSSSELLDYQVSPSHHLLTVGTNGDYESDTQDGTYIAAVFCPSDKPDQGDRQYIPEASANGGYGDCAEYPHQLVRVDAKTGKYETLNEGEFTSVVAMNDQLWYVLLNKGDTHTITEFLPTTKELKPLDSSIYSGLKGKVIDVKVKELQVPIAEIYSQEGSVFYVALVDLTNKKLITILELDPTSTFGVIGAL